MLLHVNKLQTHTLKEKKIKHLNILTVSEVITQLCISMPSYNLTSSQKSGLGCGMAQRTEVRNVFKRLVHPSKYAFKYYPGYSIIVIILDFVALPYLKPHMQTCSYLCNWC